MAVQIDPTPPVLPPELQKAIEDKPDAATSSTTLSMYRTRLSVYRTQVSNLRSHLANERTHLSYLRTTVSLIGFGTLFGTLGVILAAPLAVVTMVLVKRLYVIETLETPTPIPGETKT